MTQSSKIHLAILKEDESGIQVLESEETTYEHISAFYQYHHALESEYERMSKTYDSLRHRYESTTMRNEQILTSLVSILTAYGVYDAQKHSVNLEPVIRPYFEKLIQEHEQRMTKQGFFQERWEDFKLRYGFDTKTTLMGLGLKTLKFIFSRITVKAKS